MSALLSQLEGRERRAECEKHDELERLRASHQRLKEALEATLSAMERARTNMHYAISDKPVRDAAETYGECARAERMAREALRSAP